MLSQRLFRVVISTIDDQQNTPDSPDKHHRCSAKDYVLCNYIIEYQQQHWAASQPRGFRFLIQHHLLLAGLFRLLANLESISVIKLAAVRPADARGYDVGMRLPGRNECQQTPCNLGMRLPCCGICQ